MRPSREALERALPLMAPLSGLLLLTVLSVAVPHRDDAVEGPAFVRSTLFELKTAFAVGGAGEEFGELKKQLAEVLATGVPAERLEAPARRFLALSMILLGHGADAASKLPENDPARAWVADLAAGRTPSPPDRYPDVGVTDPWLDARLALAVAATRAGLPDGELNRLKDRAFRQERAHLERMSGFVGLAFVLFAGGMVFLFRLRPLLESAAASQVVAPVPHPMRLDRPTALRLGLGWLAAHLALSIFAPPVLAGLPGMPRGPIVPAMLTYMASAAVGLFLVTRVAYRDVTGARASTLPDVLLPTEGRELASVLWAVGGLSLAFVLVLGASMLRAFVPEDDLLVNPGVRALLLIDTAGERTLFLASVALVAPLFEEILFRGFVFAQLRHRFGLAAAASVSAALFALVHFSLGSFLPLFALGLVLAWAYEATGNLMTSMLIHAAWNAGTALIVMKVVM
jgi:membrane protease YdiL (CAAX protease family)